MKKSFLIWAVLVAVALFFSGCLTCEKKVYTFEIKSDNSGRLTIKYINIMSIKDDSLDVSEEDFQSLQNDYLNGEELQNSFPDATVVSRKLFKEGGVLCGEVVYDFPDLRAAKLFKYKGQGPFMYCLGCNSLDAEYYNESNGEYGNENMPVVFWEEGTKKLTMTTDVTTPDETTVSLLDNYLEYQKSH
jgi:hypothetical protein